MSYPDEFPVDYPEDPAPEAPVVAPAPPITAPWAWSPNSLLWIAGGVLVASFGIWFLMSFSRAKLAVSGDDGSE